MLSLESFIWPHYTKDPQIIEISEENHEILSELDKTKK